MTARWWWRRWRAKHHYHIAWCDWLDDDNPHTTLALERAIAHLDQIDAARP